MPSLPMFIFFRPASIIPGGNARAEKGLAAADSVAINPWLARQSAERSVLLALRNGTARQPDLGEHRRVIAERLVHVRNDLHHLAEQRALAVVDHFGNKIRADRLAV